MYWHIIINPAHTKLCASSHLCCSGGLRDLIETPEYKYIYNTHKHLSLCQYNSSMWPCNLCNLSVYIIFGTNLLKWNLKRYKQSVKLEHMAGEEFELLSSLLNGQTVDYYAGKIYDHPYWRFSAASPGRGMSSIIQLEFLRRDLGTYLSLKSAKLGSPVPSPCLHKLGH